MSETEVCFRAALHEEQYFTAAVLLAQLVAAHYLERGYLSLAQDAQLQRICLDLLSQKRIVGADALIQEAVERVL